MEQVNTFQKGENMNVRQRAMELFNIKWCWQSRVILLLLFITGNLFSGYAQIGWIDQGVSLSTEQMTVLGPNEILTIAFIPDEDLDGAKVIVTQPVGVNYSTHAGEVNNISLKPDRTVSTTDGIQTNTFTYTSPLNKQEPVVLQITLATVRTAEEGNIVVSIQNKEGVELDTKNYFLRLVIPDIIASSDEPVKVFDSTSDAPHRFELNLAASVGEATQFRIWLETDMYSKLENFSLGDKTLTIAEPTAITATKSLRYIVIVTTNDLDGGKLTQFPQTLSFDASSTYGGDHTITTTSIYPNIGTISNILSQVSGVELMMRYPAEAGAPDIGAPNMYFTSFSDPDTKITNSSNSWWKLPLHGNPAEPNMLHVVFTNKGVEAYELKTTISSGAYGYMDIDNIYYQIGEGEKTKLESDCITVKYKLQTNYSHYANYHSDEPLSIIIAFPKDVSLPTESQLHLEIPMVVGQIFDNTTVNEDYAGSYIYSVSAEPISAVSKGGIANAGKALSYYTANSFPPNFPAVLGEIQLRSGETGVANIPITPSYTNATYGVSQDFFVRIPEWLSLTEGDPIKWISNTNASIWYESTIPAPVIESDGSKTYTWNIAGTLARTACTVGFTYTANDFSPGEPNKEGLIHYGTNFIVGNEKFESITQRFQTVTLLCKKDGIELNRFRSVRKTVGLRDTDNDGLPDSREEALPEDGIRNDLFLVGDRGELVWEATVLENNLDYLYLPFETTITNLFYKSIHSGNYTVDEAGITLTISREGEEEITEFMTYHEVAGSTVLRYLSFHKEGFEFRGGDKLLVRLPFQVRTGVNNVSFYPVTTQCFLTPQAVTDPFADNIEGRVGTDKATLEMKGVEVRNYIYNGGSNGVNFYNTETPGVNNAQMWYFFPLYNTGIPTDAFPFEVRQTSYPREFSFEFPEGYELIDIRITEGASSAAAKTIDITPSIEGNKYTYNFEDKFSMDGADGKVIYPEGTWRMYVYGTVKATQSAPSGRTAMPYKVIFHNFYGENTPETITEGTFYFNYLGVGTSLDLSTTELPASSGRLSTPLTVGNPNDFDIKDIWLYVDGNVSTIELAGSGGSTSITGTGTGRRWFQLPQLSATQGLSYTLFFNYDGDGSSAEDIKIYTFTGFNAAWDNIYVNDASFNPSDDSHIAYRGAIRQIRILPTSSVISGQIRTSLEDNTPRSKLVYNTSYTVSANINTRSSAGEIRNPSIWLDVPAGQVFDGTATITWNGSTEEVQGTLIDDLMALGSVGGRVELKLAEALGKTIIDMPGRLGATNQLEARFNIAFKPDCETPLDGFRFEGTLAGSTPFNEQPKGYGDEIRSAIILPSINSNYSFEMAASFENAISAFNPYRKGAILQVDITRKGTTQNTAPEDVLRLRVPCEMNVDPSGSVNIVSTALGIDLSDVESKASIDEDNENIRVILINLPVSLMNVPADKGNGKTVTFRIPLVFEDDPERLTDEPVQEIRAAVISNQSFGAGCPPKPADIGSVEPFSIAWVAMASSSAIEAQVGVAVSMGVESDGFEGAWYRDAAGSNQLSGSENNPWNFTALTSDIGVTPFWVSAVFEGKSYGYVPVAMEIYPSLGYSRTTTIPLCEEKVYSTAMIRALVSGLAAGVDVKFYESNNNGILTGEIAGDLTVSDSRTIWVQSFVTAKPDKKGEPKDIRFVMHPQVSISKNLDNTQTLYIDFESSATLSITAANASGYAWYKDGAQIQGEESSSLVVTESGTYYVYALSQNCSNIKSNEVVAVVCPSLAYTLAQPQALCSTTTYDLSMLSGMVSGLSSGVSLKFYRTEDLDGEIMDEIEIAGSRSVWVQSYMTANPDKKAPAREIIFTMTPPVVITGNLDDSRTVYLDYGTSTTLAITATGASEGYAWYKDGVVITGEESNSITVTEAGVYYAEAISTCTNVKSKEVTVSVYPPLDITVTTPLYMCDNASGIDLATAVTYETGVVLEFYQDGSLLPNSFVKPTVTTMYEVKPKNARGTYGTTKEILVTVEKSTKILSQPNSGYLSGGTYPLQVIAEGGSLLYQWEKEVNGVFSPIGGANADVYDATETGKYRVVVSGVTTACGTKIVTSDVATVSAYIPPQTDLYTITTDASYGDILVTLYRNDNWEVSSGSYVDAGTTVRVTASPSTEYSGLQLEVFTANGQPIVNGQLLQIWEDTHIVAKFQIDGNDPNPDPVGNTEVKGDRFKIWTGEEMLYIQTEEPSKAYVMSFSGMIIAVRDLMVGENRFPLQKGPYIVRVGDKVVKVIVK